MRRLRIFGAGSVPAAVLGVLLGLASPAAAAPVTGCIASSVCVTVRSGGDTVAAQGATVDETYSVSVAGGDVASATLVAHQDPALVANGSSVRIDGSPAPAGAVTAVTDGLSIDLSSVLPLTPAADVTVSFTATVSATVDRDLTSFATVSFDDAAHRGPATSTSENATVSLERPDLHIDANSTVTPVRVPRGASTSVGSRSDLVSPQFTVYNNGLAASADLVVNLSPGFTLGPAGVTSDNRNAALSCTRPAAATWTCGVGTLTSPDILTVDLAAVSTTAPGTAGSLTATLRPRGISDANPADDVAQVPVVVVGSADLTVSLTAGTSTPRQGQAVTITATIANAGPDPATGLAGSLQLVPVAGSTRADFKVADADSTPWPSSQSRRTWALPSPLPPGASTTVHWQVTGLRSGAAATFAILVQQQSYDPNVACSPIGCETTARTTVTVSAASPATTPASAAGTSPSAGSQAAVEPALAATGTPGGTLAVLGIGALLAGVALVCAGRRRTTEG